MFFPMRTGPGKAPAHGALRRIDMRPISWLGYGLFLAGWLAGFGLELVDIKYEFGLVGEQLVLMDELSAGNMRVWDQGRNVEALALARRVLPEED